MDTGLPAELTVVVPCYNERANVAPMVARLGATLAGVGWEAIFVDDDSPDGTAAEVRAIAAIDPRVRCIRRVGRRGLASAVIEGALASSAKFIAVIDGDLQHDETRLPVMLAILKAGEADIIIASRFAEGGDAAGLSSGFRHKLSAAAIRIADSMLPARLSDPMSGFFMLEQSRFERLAPNLTGQGFKILLDLLLSARGQLRVREIGATFHARAAGESKLSPLVMLQFGALLLDKTFNGVVPLRFLAFALVGAFGVLVNLAVLGLAGAAGMGFDAAQLTGTIAAMVANFELNNVLTYRDQQLRGARMWRGLALFMVVCGVGGVANIGIARALYHAEGAGPTPAAALGAIVGVVWNYTMSATLVWGRRSLMGRRRA
ncbi:MAG TPA: glycosyltransferase family 2 protein [Acetobacteraceae bacterium]|nr:glycosyltransferase family 2 protein [Acetobacteraceae bacterium]